MSERFDPLARDRLVERTRLAGWFIGAAAAGATALLSVVAAHAFRGHGGSEAHAAAPPAASTSTTRITVPAPQRVPAIGGAPPPLQPPASPPEAAPPQPAPAQPAPPQPAPAQPAPVTSGGS